MLAFLMLLETAFAQPREQPNIVLILADDMGYSDLGCFGSEIATPHLDNMAREGVKMTNFYNASRCCPSRASLLTGVYPHQAGIGDMMNTRPYPAYQGYLNRETITIAEVLREAGYGTYMTGKWHVGQATENWPLKRGFDRYYGLIDGANSYFENRPYRPNQKLTIALDNQPITPPQTYYSTDAYTDYAISFVDEHLSNRRAAPFFLYIAYQAPHWPLHAKPEDIARYQGRYMDGWEVIRQQRFAKQQALGLFPPETVLSPLDTTIVPDWESLSWREKVQWDERMAVYAAMVDAIDQNVGKLITYLRAQGELDNTIFLFLSDNGASNETITNEGFTEEIREADAFPASHPRSFTAYGPGGAVVSNTPFRKFKHWEFEGGNATSFIAYGSKYVPKSVQNDQPAHLIDLMPSIVNWAGATYPKEFRGHTIQPMEGEALTKIWKGDLTEERAICFEHEGNKAVRKGKWKLVAEYPENTWYLYDLVADRAETIDVKEKYPKVVSELKAIYQTWADRVGVIPYGELDKKRGNDRYK